MIERTIIIPDAHLEQDLIPSPYKLVARNFIPKYKPDRIIILGDFMELTAVSHWVEHKPLLIENRRYKKECDVANRELDFLSKHTKEIVYCEGNHENWVEQYIEHHPNVQDDFELYLKLRLKERGIEWIPMNKLYQLGKCYFTHGVYTNKHHALKHLTSYGCSLVYGHTHNANDAQMNMKMQDPIMAWGLGCLCGHEPHFMKNKPCNWINQFAIYEHNTKTGRFNLTPVNITDNQFIYNGKEYR